MLALHLLSAYSKTPGQSLTARPAGSCAFTYRICTVPYPQPETICVNEGRKHSFGTTLVLPPWLLYHKYQCFPMTCSALPQALPGLRGCPPNFTRGDVITAPVSSG